MTTSIDVESVARALADPAGLERLRRRHREEARADLDRIHPTWLVRALQDESPAVRSVVAAHGPEGLGRALPSAGGLPAPDRPPHPEVLTWVLSLWAERLVGGSDRDDHPPVIAALTRTSPREAYRLWRGVGLVKSALAREGGGPGWVEERLGKPSPETRVWAARDAAAVARSGVTGIRGAALLGLVTAFRLLPACEPFVMRWALQRLPYPIVRQARGVAPQSSRPSPAVLRLEGLILKTAWDRVDREGRILTPHPAPAARSDDER
ncbi:hypothetical protein [Paludisphaera mucosa]|uniref:Uncharacterized protein n=1 Tax=Paludisphaera mucosa TaxID=3030827 RepID=A0ABT6F799_9BACT|nr:hypothetical protein [Paludisphaera mucosa]MDG3003455.1 hypothetical protein [Paludisphaera mucosa]